MNLPEGVGGQAPCRGCMPVCHGLICVGQGSALPSASSSDVEKAAGARGPPVNCWSSRDILSPLEGEHRI